MGRIVTGETEFWIGALVAECGKFWRGYWARRG